MPDQLRINDDVVASLRHAVLDGASNLGNVPGLLKRVLAEGMWRERVVVKTGELVQFDRFEQFVSTPPLKGLGATMQLVRNLIRDDPETEDLLDQAVKNDVGRPKKETFDIVQDYAAPTGNTRDAALRRLRKSAPKLHAKVTAGEMSAHAAMVEAGFRKRPTPLAALKSAWAKASKSERSEFLSWVKG